MCSQYQSYQVNAGAVVEEALLSADLVTVVTLCDKLVCFTLRETVTKEER